MSALARRIGLANGGWVEVGGSLRGGRVETRAAGLAKCTLSAQPACVPHVHKGRGIPVEARVAGCAPGQRQLL